MIASEQKTAAVTVRIHDEHCADDLAQCLPQISRIVSGSYKRRNAARVPRS